MISVAEGSGKDTTTAGSSIGRGDGPSPPSTDPPRPRPGDLRIDPRLLLRPVDGGGDEYGTKVSSANPEHSGVSAVLSRRDRTYRPTELVEGALLVEARDGERWRSPSFASSVPRRHGRRSNRRDLTVVAIRTPTHIRTPLPPQAGHTERSISPFLARCDFVSPQLPGPLRRLIHPRGRSTPKPCPPQPPWGVR